MLKNIKRALGVSESLDKFTKPLRRAKHFTKVKDIVPPIANYNFMADLLFLPNDKGYRYLLVMVDLASDYFDAEPIKDKQPSTVLTAMKKMFKRPYIGKPEASVATDDGSEFKGVFHKYLQENYIYHKIAEPDRHSQMANVERLNRTLGDLLNAYMNNAEKKSGKTSRAWRTALPTIRSMLNKHRGKKLLKDPLKWNIPFIDYLATPKFKPGDIVYRATDAPLDALGRKQNTKKFREGDFRWDMNPKKIKKVLNFPGKVKHRYVLHDIPHISYTEAQLMKSKKKEQEFVVEKLLKKKTVKRQKYYLVKWKGFPKSKATWELGKNLIEDGLEDMIKKSKL